MSTRLPQPEEGFQPEWERRLTSGELDNDHMTFAYADPPYIGQAQRLYGEHRDYAGEVDHVELIDRLNREYDGWALSASMKSLHYVLGLCPDDVMVLAWVKPNAPPFGDGRMYAWEPVIMRGGRNPSMPTRTALIAIIKTFGVGPEHVTGQKPPEFSRWLFACAGLTPDDEFIDLFPGSGAVGHAWEVFCAQRPLFDHVAPRWKQHDFAAREAE